MIDPTSMNLNIISDYNKIFTGNVEKVQDNMESTHVISEFDNILNNKIQNFADVEYNDQSGIELVQPAENVEMNAATMLDNFKSAFSNGLNAVNEQQINAQRATEILASGGDIDIHEVMIASQKANLSMQLALQMRNRMISFYNELKNINF